MEITENGTFMSTEKLLRKVDPELATSNLIISKTFQKQSEVESSMRASASGKGLRIDVTA